MLNLFRQKTYRGIYSGYTAANTAFASIPGLTAKVTGNASLTDLVGETVAAFLKECSCTGCRYDSEKHWVYIFGCPFIFYVANSTYGNAKHRYVHIYSPFSSTLFFTGSVASGTGNYTKNAPFTFVFDTTNNHYEITIRLLGEPTNAFILIPGTYVVGNHTGTSAGFPTSYSFLTEPRMGSYIEFVKGRDLFRGLNAVVYQQSLASICITDVDTDGNIVDTGYKPGSYYNLKFQVSMNTTVENFNSFGKKFFLMKVSLAYFELESYVFLMNSGLGQNKGILLDTQPFFTINDETFFIGYLSERSITPVVKCVT